MNDQTSFDTITRVAAGNGGIAYDRVAIALHWITALLVLVQLVNGITWDYWAKPTRQGLESIHVSLGVLLAAVIVVRLIWRWLPGHRVSPLEVGWVRIASKAVHYLLYALLVAQAVTGFAWRWAQGRPAGFFGLFGIPGPYGEQPRPVRMQLHEVHEWIAYAIAALALGHASAALYRHYVLQDRVLARMLPLARRSAG